MNEPPGCNGQSAGAAAEDAVLVTRDVTCTWCSCMCDDLHVETRDNRLISTDRACELGRQWFAAAPQSTTPCHIDGQPASLEAGLSRAAEILRSARSPLVYGFRSTSCEALQCAVELAERLGAQLDTAVSVGHGSSIVAYHDVGKVCCSLGEIRNRGDLLVCWGANPVESHPRFLERSMPPYGRFLESAGRKRTLIVVDVRETATAAAADLFLKIRPGSDFEALWVLRALAADVELSAKQVEQLTGVTLDDWRLLMNRMKQAMFGSLLFGMGVMRTRGENANVAALFALTRDMNRHTRFVCRSLKGRGNVVGADNVLTWQTGYPFAVNMARGYPRYSPGEYSAEATLSRREADAALVVGTDAASDLSKQAYRELTKLPLVVIGSQPTSLDQHAKVHFSTCRVGIESAGTVYRMDEVPVQLRSSLVSSLPSEHTLIAGLATRI